MPLNKDGKFILLDEWLAQQEEEKAEAVAEGVVEPEVQAEAPKVKRGSRGAKKDAAAQVMAQLGIDPGTAITTETIQPAEAVQPEPEPVEEPA